MKHLVRKHKRKIIAGNGIVVITLLATSALGINNGDAVLFFMPHSEEKVLMGETFDIDVNINSKVPINALGTTIKFPPETIEVVGISKASSFLDLWTEDTVIKEEAGEIRFSGGTIQKGGISGTATALTITLRAKKDGEAYLRFEDAQVYASDGTGMPVTSESRSYTYTIMAPQGDSSPGGEVATNVTVNALPTPDLDDNGSVNLVDVSILVIKIVGPYRPRYDLDGNGSLGLSDLSVLFSHMSR